MNHEAPRVLVATSDDAQRELFVEQMCEWGSVVFEARTGPEALATAELVEPQLIITDLRMPGGGVVYIAQLVKCQPQARIVVMTAYGTAETPRQLREAGAAAYIPIPAPLADLERLVRRLLHTRGCHRAVSSVLIDGDTDAGTPCPQPL